MNIPFFPLVFLFFFRYFKCFFSHFIVFFCKSRKFATRIESFTDIFHHTAQHQALFNETVRHRSRL